MSQLLRLWGFDVKAGRELEFKRWLGENESALHGACPPGVHYDGTYTSIISSEKASGSHWLLWKLDNYGAIDTFASAEQVEGPFGTLVKQLVDFMDQSPGANWSQALLRSTAKAMIWVEPREA